MSEQLIAAFGRTAREVPAYRQILSESGTNPGEVSTPDDFKRLVPIIDKASTFDRFSLPELCRDGHCGQLLSVLTSSGHSGRFSFGLYDVDMAAAEVGRIDDILDMLLGVRSRPTLLINCLPMGVKVPTQACTLAETSVRADMATALVARLGQQYDQLILVGEAAFIKLVLESGLEQEIDWRKMLVHVIVGEEPLAENARMYFQDLLGCDGVSAESGLIGSSMGAAELGLNLFLELPPLVMLRQTLHKDASLRSDILGRDVTCVPMLFTYDPAHVFVETCGDDALVISTLQPRRLPLIRYATGDRARLLTLDELAPVIAACGLAPEHLPPNPVIVAVYGRDKCARAGEQLIYPEQVKEGLYARAELAKLTTANFRILSGPDEATIRIQLSPGLAPDDGVDERFAEAIAEYVCAPFGIRCERYETFGSGMALDYERKFDYLGDDREMHGQ